MTQAPATPELVEKLRSRKEYLLGGPRRLMNLCEQAADALEAQQARIAELEDERDDAISQLKYWFDLSAKLEEQAAPVVLAGLIGHLRTARNGGMPTAMADAASVVLEDYCRLSLGRDLVPVLRGMSRSLAVRYEKALRFYANAVVASQHPDRLGACDDGWAARQALSSQGRHEGGEDSSSQSQPCGVGPSDLTDPQSQHSDGAQQ